MTKQYLVGELSLILGELQAVATNEAAVREIRWLRQEIAIWAELWEFGDCAGFLEEGQMTNEMRRR